MNIEKLIEQLNGYFEGKELGRGAALDAATVLSTFQAENEKLQKMYQEEKVVCHATQVELEKVRESLDFARTKDAEILRLGMELGRLKKHMERLTHRLGNGEITCNMARDDCRKMGGDCQIDSKILDRLAAYEKTGLEPEDFKRAFTEDALLKLTGQLLGVTPDRLRELAQADREGRCVVLPLDDYTWTIRGDIVRGIIKANCRAAKKEAEAALRREKLMANKPVIGYQVCPYCGGKVPVIWDGNRKETCMYCKKRFQLKRQKLKNTMRVNCPPEGEVGMVKYIGNGGDQNGATDI